MLLSHSQTIPPPTPFPWKNCLPQNWSLVPKRSRTTGLEDELLVILYNHYYGLKTSASLIVKDCCYLGILARGGSVCACVCVCVCSSLHGIHSFCSQKS